MDKERFPSKDLPIEELVERYLSLPNNVAPDLEALPEDLDYLLAKDGEVYDDLCEFVQDGTLDPGTADAAIKNSADLFKKGYPGYKKSIDIIYLFDRGKIWIAHSMYLSNIGAPRSEIERTQEKSARLFLRTGLALGVITSLLSSSIYNSLYISGHRKQAAMVGKKSFSAMYLTKNREEAVKLAQAIGEKDPIFYKEGLVRPNNDKLAKSGLN